jgi:hypothetical protein
MDHQSANNYNSNMSFSGTTVTVKTENSKITLNLIKVSYQFLKIIIVLKSFIIIEYLKKK